jgi:pimeloyl-ACP methyl ester carboxylesterase
VAQSQVTVEPVRVGFDAAVLDDLGRRLSAARLAPDGGTAWEQGVPRSWLAGVLADWQRFDTAAFQTRLDRLAHWRAVVDGQVIHLVREPGLGPAPLPLLLTHGWPGSFCDYLDIMPLLTDPGAHGGDPGDAFTVVAPSLPGFGFSGPVPAGGLTAEAVAGLWHRLMGEGLGYRRYVAHGSDLGAGVTARLARAHPGAVAGIHLATPGLAPPSKPWSPAEQAHFAEVDAWTGEGERDKVGEATRRASRGPVSG